MLLSFLGCLNSDVSDVIWPTLPTHPSDKELVSYIKKNHLEPLDIRVFTKETLILTKHELISVWNEPSENDLLQMSVGWEPTSNEVKAVAKIDDEGLMYFVIFDKELIKNTIRLEISNSIQNQSIELNHCQGMFIELGKDYSSGGSIEFVNEKGEVLHREVFW